VTEDAIAREEMLHTLRQRRSAITSEYPTTEMILNGADLDLLIAAVDERDQLIEQLAIRSESGMAKDMQAIMKINNDLHDRLQAAERKRG
jgi:hypothetical protein